MKFFDLQLCFFLVFNFDFFDFEKICQDDMSKNSENFELFQKNHQQMKEKSFLRRKMPKIFACGAQKWFISKAFWFKTDPKSLKSPPKGAKFFGVEIFLIRAKRKKTLIEILYRNKPL